MSEKLPTSKTIEGVSTAQEREEDERYKAWMADHPAVEVVPDSSETCAEKVKELESMFEHFEQTYDLEALRAITQFSSVEERRSSFRQPALEALTPMFTLLRYLLSQEAVAQETRDRLNTRYHLLHRAVGQLKADPTGNTFEIVVHGK